MSRSANTCRQAALSTARVGCTVRTNINLYKLKKKDMYPILEYDPGREAYIEPSTTSEKRDVPEICVICFFKEVIDKVTKEEKAKAIVPNQWEDGLHPLYQVEYKGHRLAFIHPGVRGPLAAGILERIIAQRCTTFMVCGSCGVLDTCAIDKHLVCIDSAIRDEGTSYHYLPPGHEIRANEIGLQVMAEYLDEKGIPYATGKTWITDAPYRETRAKIEKREA